MAEHNFDMSMFPLWPETLRILKIAKTQGSIKVAQGIQALKNQRAKKRIPKMQKRTGRNMKGCWSAIAKVAGVRKECASSSNDVCNKNTFEDCMKNQFVTLRHDVHITADDGLSLLQQLEELSSKCKSVRHGSENCGNIRVECLAKGQTPNFCMWIGHCVDSVVPIACSEVELDGTVSIDDVVNAIFCVDQRMTWDSESFVQFDILQHCGHDAGIQDLIYCRMPAPCGLRDRDVVQERFLMDLPSGDGRAIVMRSPVDSAGHLKSPVGGVVRAQTLLSGYTIRRSSRGSVVVTVLSQTDLGGSVPQWMQTVAKRGSKGKFLDWANRLQKYCQCKNVIAAPGFDGQFHIDEPLRPTLLRRRTDLASCKGGVLALALMMVLFAEISSSKGGVLALVLMMILLFVRKLGEI